MLFRSLTHCITPGREDVDLETKVYNVRDIVHQLPAANFDLLKRIVEHLEKYVPVCDAFAEERKLTNPSQGD